MGQCVSRPEAASEAIEVPVVAAKGPSVQEQPQIQAKDVPEPSPNPGLPYKANLLGPPPPPCEDDRLATLKALKLNGMTVEAPPDPEIENILKLVASIFQAPSALVALFDDKKIFIRETQGGFTRGDFPWRWSFCAWTMAAQQDQIMVIPDATKDVRFAENINVTCEGGVRFYCGAPLIASNGHRLGTLCFADTKPREFDSMQASILGNFAEMVVRHVEKDIALQLMSCDNEALSHAYKNLKRTIDCFEHCVVLLDTSQPGWKIMHTNAAWEKATGCRREGVQGVTLAEVMEAMAGPLPSRQHQEAVTAGKTFTMEGARVKASWLAAHAAGSGSRRSLEATSSGSRSSNSRSRSRRLVLKLRPAGSAPMDEDTLALAVPSWVANAKISDQSGAAGAPLYFMTIESAEAVKAQMFFHPSRSLSSPVQGLQLGQLLGSGSFGSVYAGHWFGTPVAIKVIDQDLKALEAAGAQVEAVLGSELRHPHIVATLTYAVHNSPSSGTVSAVFSDDTAQQRSGSVPHGSRPPSACQSRATPPPAAPPPKPTTNTRAAPMADSVQSLADVAAAAASNVHVEMSDSGNCSGSRPGSALSGGVTSSGAVETSSARTSSQANSMPNNALFSVMEVAADSQVGFLTGDGIGMSEYGSLTGLQAEIGMGLSLPQHVAHNIGNRQQTWIVLEFCDKGTLQDAVDRGWLRKPGSSVMNMTAVISTACEVASALLYLHSHGVVHGDLSAWNVLLTTSGAAAMAGGRGFIAKVADFGLSRSLDIKTRIQTRTYGTITHQPPETLLEGLVSRETDTYSLGVLLWQMYTGSRPWGGMTHAQIIMAVASGSARLTFPPDAPHEYAALAMACMAFDAAERPSMAAVCTTLECMKSSRHSIDQASGR